MPLDVFATTGAGQAISTLTRGTKAAVVGAPGASDFAEKLGSFIDNVDKTSSDANVAVTNMVEGHGDVHEAMIALQRAEMTLQLTVQVRNKLVQAYQEIMRMPI